MSEGPLYVYGIARASGRARDAVGVDGRAIRMVTEGKLGALVSDAEPGPVETTRDRLLAHSRVLEEIAATETVLPMRFGVVAPSEQALREGVLGPRRRALLGMLERLDGHVELGVKMFFREAPVLREIVGGSPAVRRLLVRVRNKPEEATYYDRIDLGEAVAGAMRAIAAREGDRIAAALERLAVDTRRREPAGERMVLSEALLVPRDGVRRVERAVEALGNDGRLLVRVTGPRPPYSFVDVELAPPRKRARRWAS